MPGYNKSAYASPNANKNVNTMEKRFMELPMLQIVIILLLVYIAFIKK